MKKVVSIILLFFMASSLWGAPQNRYVRTPGNGGDNGNGGTSWADAWATVQYAADNTDPANGLPATINIAAGTYAEMVRIDTYAGTDDDNRIIFDGDIENDSGDGASRPIIEGAGAQNIYINAKDYITLQDLEAKDSGNNAIWASSSYVIIERCVAYNALYAGIGVARPSAGTAGHIVRNNIIYNCNTSNYTGASGAGICFFNWASGCYCYNNTVFNNKQSGIQCRESNAGREGSVTIKNNIAHDNTVDQIYVGDDWTVTSDYNNWYADNGTRCGYWKGTDCAALSDWQTASSQDANSVEGDPLYVDEAEKDFHITDNASPCYQNGTDLSVTFTDDYDKDTRVHWDIGADYIASEAPPEAPKVQSQILLLD